MKAQRIIEIAEDGRFVGIERGFLVVSAAKSELGRIPLDDIAAVICNSNYATLSTAAISALAAHGIPLVVCDKKTKRPSSFLVTLEGNYRQGDIMSAQADAKLPLRKSLWKDIVKAKLLQQAEVLLFFGKSKESEMLSGLAELVRSGDSENCEARGAAVYWKALMGEYFRRDKDADDENVLFNYGYTVVRACMMRAISSAGLHPSIGLHHRSSTNTARLADDLMEPFRPFIDLEAKAICKEADDIELTVENKRRLSGVVDRKIGIRDRETTLQTLMFRLSVSLAQVFAGERGKLDIQTVKMRDFYGKTTKKSKSKRTQTYVDDGDV